MTHETSQQVQFINWMEFDRDMCRHLWSMEKLSIYKEVMLCLIHPAAF